MIKILYQKGNLLLDFAYTCKTTMTLHALSNMPFLAINPVIEPIGRVGLNKAQLSLLQKKPKRPIYKEAIFSKWDCQDALQSQGWASCQTGFSLTLSVALHLLGRRWVTKLWGLKSQWFSSRMNCKSKKIEKDKLWESRSFGFFEC